MAYLRAHITLVLGLIIIVAAGMGYYYYSASSSLDQAAALLATAPGTESASSQLVTSLGVLRSVKLDPAIFAEPDFRSLADYGVVIPPQPVGRTNPFAPLSGSGGSGSLPKNIQSGTAKH